MNQPTPEGGQSRTAEVSEESKLSAIRALAIVGLIATVIILVWLAVLAVRVIPSGFAHLAALIESINSPTASTEFSLGVNPTIVEVSTPTVLTLSLPSARGVFGVSYSCADGVAGTLNGESIPCGAWHAIPSGSTSAALSFTSEKRRYADISVSVRFTPEEGETSTEKSALVTVVNSAIAEDGAETPVTTPEPDEEPEAPKPAVPKPPVTTVKVPVYTTSLPVSNPNGYTDLELTFIGVGTYNDRTDTFDQSSSLDNDDHDNAMRFAVKNIGTKTSGSWSYRAELPTADNTVFRSFVQAPLRPQERAVITILLGDDIRERSGTVSLDIDIDGGGDIRSTNNSTRANVRIDN